MAIFCVIFASCIFSEPRAAGFRHAFEIRTKATPGAEVWYIDIQSPTVEIRRGKKKKKDRIEITGQKYNGLSYSIGRP